MEEEGHEVEGVEDEDLGSTVEEGEEAALALGVPSADSDLPWFQIKQASVDDSEAGHQSCESGDDESNSVPEEVSISMPENKASEVSSTEDWDIHRQSVPS